MNENIWHREMETVKISENEREKKRIYSIEGKRLRKKRSENESEGEYIL